MTDAVPLYAQVAADLKRQIDEGVLRAGDRLPSIRALQRARGVSAATAIEAYLRLERDGYVRARSRSGFYVAQPPAQVVPEPQAGHRVDRPAPVGVGAAVLDLFRVLTDSRLLPLGNSAVAPSLMPNARINRTIRAAATRMPLHASAYGPPSGFVGFRRQLARLALSAGITCSADDFVVTAGGMEALNLALRAVAAPGDVVAVESPTYFGVLQVLQSLGVKAIGVPTDPRRGVDLTLLERAIVSHRVKAVMSMPTCHNPLGTVMSDADKAALVALTAKHRVALIEDDVYGDLAFGADRPRAARSFDRDGHVIWCGSMSKVVGPGLRVGWILSSRFRARVELLKNVSSFSSPVLVQVAMAELLDSGFYARHVRRLRARLADHVTRYTQAIADEFPKGTKLTRPAGGSLLWVQLPRKADGTALFRRALEAGIAITPGELFSTDGKFRDCVRLSCGTPWSPAIERGIATLGRLAR